MSACTCILHTQVCISVSVLFSNGIKGDAQSSLDGYCSTVQGLLDRFEVDPLENHTDERTCTISAGDAHTHTHINIPVCMSTCVSLSIEIEAENNQHA